jgi:hypothetical protein
MDDMPSNDPTYPKDADSSLLVRMLYDEQTRLRAEIDELRRKQEQVVKQGRTIKIRSPMAINLKMIKTRSQTTTKPRTSRTRMVKTVGKRKTNRRSLLLKIEFDRGRKSIRLAPSLQLLASSF